MFPGDIDGGDTRTILVLNCVNVSSLRPHIAVSVHRRLISIMIVYDSFIQSTHRDRTLKIPQVNTSNIRGEMYTPKWRSTKITCESAIVGYRNINGTNYLQYSQ